MAIWKMPTPHRKFYDEYNAVLDMPAEYSIPSKSCSKAASLPRGRWDVHGQRVKPADIQRTALLTIEGELDDISGIGQTWPRMICAVASRPGANSIWKCPAPVITTASSARWREVVYPGSAAILSAHRSQSPSARRKENQPGGQRCHRLAGMRSGKALSRWSDDHCSIRSAVVGTASSCWDFARAVCNFR
ncbi:MAG: hypothetical protein R3F04_16685 [Lysobacteraceae bacterium]